MLNLVTFSNILHVKFTISLLEVQNITSIISLRSTESVNWSKEKSQNHEEEKHKTKKKEKLQKSCGDEKDRKSKGTSPKKRNIFKIILTISP